MLGKYEWAGNRPPAGQDSDDDEDEEHYGQHQTDAGPTPNHSRSLIGMLQQVTQLTSMRSKN